MSDSTVKETPHLMEQRHQKEKDELEATIKGLLKAAKKANKAQVEAQCIQMQYDLRAKHNEEADEMESSGVTDDPSDVALAQDVNKISLEAEKAAIDAKKAKAQNKKDKKNQKEKDKQAIKEQIKEANSGPSARDIETEQLNTKLKSLNSIIKNIPADGNCLYRAIADQLQIVRPTSPLTFQQLRVMAAQYIRTHPEEFTPFLGLLPSDPEFEVYCHKVESDTLAEWGGQLEINALCACLSVKVLVYSATAPVVTMGEEVVGAVDTLKVTFHRHYYALGEHYNSVVTVN